MLQILKRVTDLGLDHVAEPQTGAVCSFYSSPGRVVYDLYPFEDSGARISVYDDGSIYTDMVSLRNTLALSPDQAFTMAMAWLRAVELAKFVLSQSR